MAGGTFGGGSGTSASPYLVEDAADLDAVRNNLSAYYLQTADIDLSGYSNWAPIGWSINGLSPFTGRYDGAFCKISNLSINRPEESRIGLFGHVVTNLSIRNVCLYNCTVNGLDSVGSLVGAFEEKRVGQSYYFGTIESCSVNQAIVTGNKYVGGLAGYVSANIKYCYARDINSVGSGDSKLDIGGMIGYAGYSSLKITYSYIEGFTVTGAYQCGGLCGSSLPPINNCMALNGSVNVSSSPNYPTPDYFGKVSGGAPYTYSKVFSSDITSPVYDHPGVEGTDFDAASAKDYDFIHGSSYLAFSVSTWILIPGRNDGYPSYTSCYDASIIFNIKKNDGSPVSSCDIYLKIGEYPSNWRFTNDGGTATFRYYGGALINITYDWKNIVAAVPPEDLPISVTVDAGTTTTISVTLGPPPETEIVTPQDLLNIRYGLEGYKFKIMNDIDMVDFTWDPDWYLYENCEIDGQGFKIQNLSCITEIVNYSAAFTDTTDTDSMIKNMFFENVSFKAYEGACGIACYNYGTIENCVVTGIIETLEPSDDWLYAGICGENDGVVKQCVADVSITGGEYSGGICGENCGVIQDCYSLGSVSATGKAYIGGAVGENYGPSSVINVYSIGSVVGGTETGGLIGANTEDNAGDIISVVSCYYNSETSGQSDNDGRGTPKTTAEMKTQSTYSGWDFADVWAMGAHENDGYPTFLALVVIEQLLQVTQPVWSNKIVTWKDVASAESYTVRLYNASAECLDTQAVAKGVQRYDYTDLIENYLPAGSYTATVQARPEGVT